MSVRGIKLQDYGAWLQGALTPIALLIAAFAFYEQARDQRKANEINLRSHLLAGLPAYVGHLNYLCSASLNGEWVSADNVKGTEALGSMKYFLETSDSQAGAQWDNCTIHGLSYRELSKRSQFLTLREDIRNIRKQSQEAGYEFPLDNRIKEIDGLLEKLKVKAGPKGIRLRD